MIKSSLFCVLYKYKIHIDEYIVIHISEAYHGPDGHHLRIFPTIYRDKNREMINVGFNSPCETCDLQWNEDPIEDIYDEIIWKSIYLLKESRYGDPVIGRVIEVLDDNLISIELENSKIVKGMNLDGYRVWIFNKGEETLNQYISDKEDIINYYKNNPNELSKLRLKEDWRPTLWYQSAKNIDELLLLFKNEIDSLRSNRTQIIQDWKSKGNIAWDSIMTYKVEIIKVSDNEAIGKIIFKNAPYVTPQIGDFIELQY